MKARRLRKCPGCSQLRLERLISAGSGIIFKGSGFYATDYRDKAYEKEKNAAEKGVAKENKK